MAKYQEIYDALIKADQSGDDEAAEHFAKRLREKDYEQESSGVASALQGVGQGATFGFGDELGAGVRSALFDPIASMIGGENIGGVGGIKDYFTGMGERYNTNLGSQRDALETARREDPWTTGIAEVAGGLGTGGIGGAKALAGQGLRQGIKRGAGLGAGLGATAGYGYSEGDPIATALQEVMPGGVETGDYTKALDELKEAGVGVAVGAGLGVTLGAGLPVAGAMIRGTARVISMPFTRNARLNEAGRRQVMESLEQDLAAGNITIAQAKRELATTPGMKVADLGPNLQALTETIAQTPTAAGRGVREQLEQRAVGQYDRIMPAVSEALGTGGKPSMFQHHMRTIMDTAKDAAEPMYREAYSMPVRVTARMNGILHGTGVGRSALKGAQVLQNELRKKTAPVGKQGSMASMERLDYVLQSMDDHVNRLFSKPGKGKLARAAAANRDEFKEMLYDANPAFKEARNAWAGHARSNEALTLGRRAFRDDFDLTAANLAKMSEGEKTYFRVGVLREVENKLANKVDTADIVRELSGKRKNRQILETVFGGKQQFDEFMDLLGREAKMQRTFEVAVGNSATARRLAQAQTTFGEQLAKLGGYGVSLGFGGFVPPSIGGHMAGRAYQATGLPKRAAQTYEQVTGNQANLLMGGGLDDLMRPKTLGGLLGTGVPTSAAGLATGLNPAMQGLLE